MSKLFYYVLFLVNYIHTKHSTQTDRETETSNKYVQINMIYTTVVGHYDNVLYCTLEAEEFYQNGDSEVSYGGSCNLEILRLIHYFQTIYHVFRF